MDGDLLGDEQGRGSRPDRLALTRPEVMLPFFAVLTATYHAVGGFGVEAGDCPRGT